MEKHNEISEFIWNIKEHIRDEYAEKDYEEIIITLRNKMLHLTACKRHNPAAGATQGNIA